MAATKVAEDNNMVVLHVKPANLQEADLNEQEVVNLAFNQGLELLCFTTKLSSDPGEPRLYEKH